MTQFNISFPFAFQNRQICCLVLRRAHRARAQPQAAKCSFHETAAAAARCRPLRHRFGCTRTIGRQDQAPTFQEDGKFISSDPFAGKAIKSFRIFSVRAQISAELSQRGRGGASAVVQRLRVVLELPRNSARIFRPDSAAKEEGRQRSEDPGPQVQSKYITPP